MSPTTAPKRPRGRPPTPEGAKSRAEVQRAYRERAKAAGKMVMTIDTWSTMTPAEIAKMREQLRHALLQIELLEEDRARWRSDCAKAEAELKRVEWAHSITRKEKIVLQMQLEELLKRPKRRARQTEASNTKP